MLNRLPLSVLVAIGLTSSAHAQSSELGRSITDLLNRVATTSKQRKVIAELSAPLIYEEAAGPLDPANRHDPRNLDVAGVHLGMSVLQAQRALRAAGYVDSGPRDPQQSYIDRVTYQWQIQYGITGAIDDRVPQELLWRKGEEQVTVNLIALPDGPRVNEVKYWAMDGAPISSEGFTRSALAKYGEPTNDDPDDLRWCTVKAPQCEQGSDVRYPVLLVSPDNRSIVLIGNDPARSEAFDKRLAADIALRKPADQAPSF